MTADPDSNPNSKEFTLLPGDCMLYYSHDLVDHLIAIKTWTRVAHVEVYAGQHQSWASRNGIGVGLYPTRYDGLVYVLRPIEPFNFFKACDWFREDADGQKYDWLGLLCFTLAVAQGSPHKMFCSEFATRLYRHAGVELFNTEWDADRVPPSFFLVTPKLTKIWP